MLGAARAYAEANQATLITPFILAGAMAPVTVGRRRDPDARRGARRDGLRPARPAGRAGRARARSPPRCRCSRARRRSGRRSRALVLYVMAALARRLGVPFRSGGNLCASKIADAQAAYESAATLQPDDPRRASTSSSTPPAGSRAGSPSATRSSSSTPTSAGWWPCSSTASTCPRTARRSTRSSATSPGQHFLGTAHTLANFETAFYRSEIADNNSYEQWLEDGSLDAAQRANAIWKRMLAEYEAPPHRRRDRRGAPRVHRQAQGVDARLGGLSRRAVPRRSRPRRRRPAPRWAPRPRGADLRAGAAQERARSGGAPAGRRPRLGDGVAGQGASRRRSHCASRSRRTGSAPSRTCRRGWSATGRTCATHRWLGAPGVDRAFVVGGDAKEPGDYLDGLSLLRDDGRDRPSVRARSASRATRRATRSSRTGRSPRRCATRPPFASYMTTQLCFDPGAIGAWVARAGARRG